MKIKELILFHINVLSNVFSSKNSKFATIDPTLFHLHLKWSLILNHECHKISKVLIHAFEKINNSNEYEKITEKLYVTFKSIIKRKHKYFATNVSKSETKIYI